MVIPSFPRDFGTNHIITWWKFGFYVSNWPKKLACCSNIFKFPIRSFFQNDQSRLWASVILPLKFPHRLLTNEDIIGALLGDSHPYIVRFMMIIHHSEGGMYIQWVDFADCNNSKVLIVVLPAHEESTILIFWCVTQLFTELLGPEGWIVWPISFPLKLSPRISYFHKCGIVDLFDEDHWICVPLN